MYHHELEHGTPGRLKIAAIPLLAAQQIGTPILAINPEKFPYVAPYAEVTNGQNRYNRELKCPENSLFVVLNVPGVGDNMMGVYASGQVEEIMADEPGGKEICYAGFVYGTEYSIEKNTDALREFILINKPKRLIVFATSFGGIAMVDVLNMYHQRYPDDETEFGLVFISSPAEADDLQLFSRISSEALARTPLGKGLVKTLTLGSILSQPNKSLIDGQVWDDTKVASSNTPPHLVSAEAKDLIENGMDRLIVDIPVAGIVDRNDEVINVPRAIESTQRRLGRAVVVKYMGHRDNVMKNHGALSFPEYREDYRQTVIETLAEMNAELDKQQLDRRLAKIAETRLLVRMGESGEVSKKQVADLAQMAVRGKVILTVPQPNLRVVQG